MRNYRNLEAISWAQESRGTTPTAPVRGGDGSQYTSTQTHKANTAHTITEQYQLYNKIPI